MKKQGDKRVRTLTSHLSMAKDKKTNSPKKKPASKSTVVKCSVTVIGCMRAAGANGDIGPTDTLDALGVDSEGFAECINGKFGTSYKGSSFPGTMTVQQAVSKIC
jgi:hypothetical protein